MNPPLDIAVLQRLADQGDLSRLYQQIGEEGLDLVTLEQWWQGEFHLDLVLGRSDRSGPCVLVASN